MTQPLTDQLLAELGPLATVIRDTLRATPVVIGRDPADLVGALALAVAAYMGRIVPTEPEQTRQQIADIRAYCPEHGTAETCRMQCHCAIADELAAAARPAAEVVPIAADLLGTVRRNTTGTMLAVLWPSPPSSLRWMVTDRWGSCGYESDDVVASWPIVGAVPFSPAAGTPLNPATAPLTLES